MESLDSMKETKSPKILEPTIRKDGREGVVELSWVWEGAPDVSECDHCGREVNMKHKLRNHYGINHHLVGATYSM